MKKDKIVISMIIVIFSLLSFFVPNKIIVPVVGEEETCSLDVNGTISSFVSPYEALVAASEKGGIVKLTSDVNEDRWNNNIRILSNISVTFDLNGHIYNEKVVENSFKRIILEGSFTLLDSSLESVGKWNYLKEDDKDFVNKIKLDSDSNNVNVTIKGGHITNFAPFIDASNVDEGIINVEGGIFDNRLIENVSKSLTLNIKGGTFTYLPHSIALPKEESILNVNLSGKIDGFSLYCIQSNLLDNKLNINIVDDLIDSNNKIILHLIHNVSNLLDGLVVATFGDRVLNKSASNFQLKLTDTYSSVNKTNENDWKLVIIGNNLVLKNKDYVVNNNPNLTNKLIIDDNKGNRVTFTSEYKGDYSKYQDSLLVVNHLSISQKYKNIASEIKKKNYTVIDVINSKLMKDNLELSFDGNNEFYLSILLDKNINSYDNYLVVDVDKNEYYSTINEGVISIKLNRLGEYVILAKNVDKTNYLLGAIIPLSIILLLEIAFVCYYHFVICKKKKVLSLAILSSLLWSGAIPIIIIESILILGLGAYIVYILCFKNKNKKKEISNKTKNDD